MTKRITLQEVSDGTLSPKEMGFVIEYCRDHNATRAALAAGYAPDYGYKLRNLPHIAEAVDRVLQYRLDDTHLDAQWLLYELVDNHTIARQGGDIKASNTALGLIAKHVSIDAFAAAKIELNSDREFMERLSRGRMRNAQSDDEVDFF